MFITQLKIWNFMSFVGENDICLQPFTAVMFSRETGKNDFVAALHFLFGADLSHFGCQHVEELFHECLVPVSGNLYPKLEVSAGINTRCSGSGLLQISRSVDRNRMIYKINDREVGYDEFYKLLVGMRCNSNFFLAFSDFIDAIWNPDGIENVISKYVSVDFKLPKLQKALKKCAFMESSLALQSEKHCLTMIRAHKEVDEVVDEFEQVLKDQESRREKTLLNLSYEIYDSSESPSLLAQMDTTPSPPLEFPSSSQLWNLEAAAEKSLTGESNKEAELLGTILYKESKIVAVEDDISAIQARIALKVKLETRIAQLENVISEIWHEMELLVQQIGSDLAKMEYFRCMCPTSRLTSYGRLIDWIKPGPYLCLLRAALGEELLYGHLIDSREPAEKFLKLLKERRVATRVTFIILSDYSPRLKDVLFSQGEEGEPLSDILDVLKLLCKLKEFGLISRVPSVVAHGGLRLDNLPDDEEAFFLSNGEFAGDGGTFGRFDQHSQPDERSEAEVMTSVNVLLRDQEKLFDLAREQMSEVSRLRLELDSLAEEVRTVRASRSATATGSFQRSTTTMPPMHLDEIYTEYLEIFQEHKQSWEGASDSLLEGPSAGPPVAPIDPVQLKAEIKALKKELRNVQNKKKEIKQELSSLRDELRGQLMDCLQLRLVIGNPFIMPEPEKDKSVLALGLRMKALKKIIRKDEVEELKGGREWRYAVMERLNQELKETRKAVKECKKAVNDVHLYRQDQLSPFIGYCNDFISELMQWMMGGPVDRGEVRCEGAGPVRLLAGSEDLSPMDIMDFDVFSRCVALLALFLHMARYRGGMVLVLDEIHDLLPRCDADAACVKGMDDETDARFYVLTRLGDAIKAFLDKIHGEVGSSPQGDDLSSLEQVLLLTSDDLAVTTDAHVLIVNEIRDGSSAGGKLAVISKLIDLAI